MKKTMLALVFGFAAFTAGAETIDFEKYIEITSRGNRDYMIAKEELNIAAADMRIAAGRFAPVLTLQGGMSPLVKPSVVEVPAGILGPSAMSLPLSSQPAWSSRVSLSQPLITFGKLEWGFMVQQEAYEIARINFKRAEEKLKLDAIAAFYGALIAKELKAINEEALKRTEENLKITKKKYESGEVPKLDFLRAQVEASNMAPEAVRAASQYTLALKNFKSAAGLPLEKDIEPSGEAKYAKFELSYDEAKAAFEKKSDEMQITKKVTDLQNKRLLLAGAMALPSIGLDMGVNYYTFESDFRADREIWRTSWDVSIGFSWAFFDGFRNINEIAKAAASVEMQKLNEEKTSDMLSMQFEKLYSTLEENRGIIEAADMTIKTAEEGYKTAKESYMNGLARPIDLLDAELNLMKSRINYLNALYSYTVAVQELKNFIQ